MAMFKLVLGTCFEIMKLELTLFEFRFSLWQMLVFSVLATVVLYFFFSMMD